LTRESQTVQRILDSALQHHQNGRFFEAEPIYKRILDIDPDHPDCLHLMGMISHQAGDLETAADLIRKAIAIHKTGVSYYVNLGTVLMLKGNSTKRKRFTGTPSRSDRI
jgi:Flp pilus assembly protein TadD